MASCTQTSLDGPRAGQAKSFAYLILLNIFGKTGERCVRVVIKTSAGEKQRAD